jgi:hypothetical protein
MNKRQIHKFCMLQPRPKLLRATLDDDSTQELLPPRNGQSWSKLADSIAAVKPILLEAFDDDGKLLRAKREDDDDDDDQRSTPALLDPETARLTHFANLLAKSYEFSTKIAFAEMAGLVRSWSDYAKSTNERLERVESAHRRMREQQADDALEQASQMMAAAQGMSPADAKTSIMDAFVGSMMQGMMSKQQPQPQPQPQQPTNGKAAGKA